MNRGLGEMLIWILKFVFSPEGCPPRQYEERGKKVLIGLSVFIALYNLFMLAGNLWGLDPYIHYWIFILSLSVLAFSSYSPTKRPAKGLGAEGVILVSVALITLTFLLINSSAITKKVAVSIPISAMDAFLGSIMFLLIAEAARRVVGMVMGTVVGMFLFYAWVGTIWPWGFNHRGLSFLELAGTFFICPSGDGLWAIPLALVATTLVLLFLFGGLLQALGGGNLFIRIALALLGKYRGGAAKVCVLASALLGMVTGGGASGVAIVGVFTIPTMIKSGYRPHYAGAIEAVASTGAAITPPIMGAVAFIMADLLGIPYYKILLPAAIPAALYYLTCFIQVDCQAARWGLVGLSKEEIPSVKQVLKEDGEFVVPMVALILFLLLGYTMRLTALAAILGTLVAAILRKKRRPDFLRQIVAGLNTGMRTTIQVAFICALAGIIMTGVGVTGFGSKFTHFVGLVAGNTLFITLLAGAVMCIGLGTGLPITVSYIITVLLVIPVALKAGVPPLAAHMFAIYYAVMADISPPLALACFVASGIAQCDSFKIGWTAMRLAVAAYVLPFLFVYKPALLLLGPISSTVLAIITAAIGLFYLGMALEGWIFSRPAGLWERCLLFAGAIGLFWPNVVLNIIGTVIGLSPVLLKTWVRTGRRPVP